MWPLPYLKDRPTNTVEDLAPALSRGIADAGADVEDPAADVGTNALVWRQLQIAARPMILNADERHPALTMLTAFGRRPAHA
ncbi:hypothetical protein [Mycobacterium sp. 852014-52144_SCH5372336]|uniref:hypothetical protein n=1 Tax=Mycobacterium sp. 852014-52144_SCH5372336 TaxID=1834115 RepID=UPI0012E958EA|nr:hypothetical protein [Mycobacterium sp. 852014-52144_SCH5372336]